MRGFHDSFSLSLKACSSEASAASLLEDSLKDLTDVAPCRKRRFRHIPAPQPEVPRPNPQSSHKKR